MTGDKTLTDDALEALFDEAKGQATDLPEALHARILADAAEVQVDMAIPALCMMASESILSLFLRNIGGWGSLGGLVVATAAGVWIGFSNPSLVSPDAVQVETFDLAGDDGFGGMLPSDALFFEEG